MGKSSYHLNFLAQLKHFDRPKIIDCPVFKRKITTFKKLPITAPKIKIKISKYSSFVLFDYTIKNPPTTVGDFFVKLLPRLRS